jgi:hypothetical protein
MLGWPDEKVCQMKQWKLELAAFFLSVTILWPQTVVDLRTQSKSVDFSSAVSTQPSKTGVTIPATCLTGESFFKLNAPAGQNLYGCTSPNVWTLQSSGGITVASVFGRVGAVTAQTGDYSLTQLSDVTVKQGNGTAVQMFGGGSQQANDCAKFDGTGNIVSSGGTCAGGGLQAGLGITTTSSGGPVTVGVDSAYIPGILTVLANVDFANLASLTCADQTVSLTGAAIGNAVAAGWPSSFNASLLGTMWVSAANTITIRVCNLSGGPINPAAANFRITLVRSL